jgi:tetratricopeptide (TPR) repeat protein
MWRKAAGPSSSPFEVLTVNDLPASLASPIRNLPPRIDRSPPIRYDAPFQVIVGGSGVGKTRAAIDIVSTLAETAQASTVYLARGYIDALAPLPEKGPRRKVIVLIDDYDYGCLAAASTSFEERQSAYSQALENLRRLHATVDSKVELCGFIVTVNSNRMPLLSGDAHVIVPAFKFQELPPVSDREHKEFLKSLSVALGISYSEDAYQTLQNACDGRFDTIATFLSSMPKGTTVGTKEAEKYLQVQRSIWEIFRQHLSQEQRLVYDSVKALKDFGLPPRIEYLHQMLREQLNTTNMSSIHDVLSSLWYVRDDQAIVYDNQFGPAVHEIHSAEVLVKGCIAAGQRLQREKRYAFQQDMKIFAHTLIEMSENKLALTLLRKLNHWYPRDRYFAYMLARVYTHRKQYLHAILPLYRVFRKPDILVIYSGKWIEVQAHLLLAHIYQRMGLHQWRDWNIHKRIEQEFNIAASLADLEVPDLGADGFEYIGSLGSETSPHIEGKKILQETLQELGYNIPPGLSLNAKRLRAIVHHSYATYLLNQPHQEYLAIHHETTVTEILPDFGDAYLYCAKACLQLGDSQRALTFLNQAASATPQYMEQTTYSFMISSYRYQAYADLGQIEVARKYFSECQELCRYEPLCADEQLKAGLVRLAKDVYYWDRHARLAALREKLFGSSLIYRLLIEKVEIVLPADWKIAEETCSKSGQSDFLMAMFSSPLTWDDKTKTPSDASVTLFYSREKEHLVKDVQEFGLWWLHNQEAVARKRRVKCFWSMETETQNLGNATFCQWVFKLSGTWPKTGKLMAFALPQARVFLHLMWEDCGSATFRPIMESIGKSFRNQEVFLGIASHDSNSHLGSTA